MQNPDCAVLWWATGGVIFAVLLGFSIGAGLMGWVAAEQKVTIERIQDAHRLCAAHGGVRHLTEFGAKAHCEDGTVADNKDPLKGSAT